MHLEIDEVRVLLADDHELFRTGICALLEKIPVVKVIAEADSGNEAVELCKELVPDLILIDIAMPDLNGLKATEKIKSENPDVRVVILSMHAEEQYVAQALQVGAEGYLLKDSKFTELELAIESVMKGQTFLSPPISKQVIEGFLKPSSQAEKSVESVLTPRQLEVLKLVVQGHTSTKIGSLLSISSKTVDIHKRNIMNSLDIHDIPSLVLYALEIGLIDSQTP